MNRTTWLQERRMTKFANVLKRWEHEELSAQEAGELLGCSERQFRRWRRRYEEEGDAKLADRRLGRASVRRVPVDRIVWMLGEYRTRHAGWNVKHFHEYLRKQYGFEWGYTWTKLQLQSAGLVDRAKRRGAHRPGDYATFNSNRLSDGTPHTEDDTLLSWGLPSVLSPERRGRRRCGSARR